jgi:hypothetical protein
MEEKIKKENKYKKIAKKVFKGFLVSLGLAGISVVSYEIGNKIGAKNERLRSEKELSDLKKSKNKEIKSLKKKSYYRGKQKYKDGLNDGIDLGKHLGKSKKT